MRFYFLIILSFITFNTVAENAITWAEGKCSKEGSVYEGATRDFYNRGAHLRWQNQLGDWTDRLGIRQGQMPYATLTRETTNATRLSADVTALVNYWQQHPDENHGFFLQGKTSKHVVVYSKDQPRQAMSPTLTITTSRGQQTLFASKDTILKKSTYVCLGEKDELQLSYNTLIAFDLSTVTTDIKQAILSLTATKKVNKAFTIHLFATRIHHKLLDKLSPRESRLFVPVYHQGFESEDWQDDWTIRSAGNTEIISADPVNKFEPLKGQALRVTIKKGEHIGVAAHLPLAHFNEFQHSNFQSAYLKYSLRFSDSWDALDSGKLPGFSGIYGNRAYRGGWGGRRSNGQNGWSARGRFDSVIQPGNPLSGQIPIGSYLYHSDMKENFGDAIYWDDNANYLLKKNQWYQIEQFIQMNSKGRNDGVMMAWIDGRQVYVRRNLDFSNHPAINLESVWLTVYYGGKLTAAKDSTLYIDELYLATKSPYVELENSTGIYNEKND